jgi:nucleotide-binding universal stress UspA family protein
VIGARGLGRFRAKVLGSVSDRVVRHAPATFVGR